MIEAYLDETGIHDGATVCVIAGYFGGKGQWKKFERDWRLALKDFNVPVEEFHALNFMRRRKTFFQWTDDRHQALLQRLTLAITSYKIYPATVAMVIEDFKRFTEVQRRFFTGATIIFAGPNNLEGKLITSGCPNKPYFIPFQRCIKRIAAYAEVGGKAHFYFGLDRPFAKYAAALYALIKNSKQPDPERERLGMIGFPLAKETPELQAADLLAYLTGEHLQRFLDKPTRPGPELSALLSRMRMPEDHELVHYETLRQSVSMLLPIAPILAYQKEEEEDLP